MTRELHSAFERATKYVSKIPGAIQGNQGDCQTLAVANVLVWDFALSGSEALAILLREFNPRCSPPWSEAELVRKIQSAMNQPHHKPRGNLLGTARPPSASRFVNTPPTSRVKIDPVTAVENYLRGFWANEAELWEASPMRPPDDWTQDGLAFVEALYQPGEQINFVTDYIVGDDGKARPKGCGATMERDALLVHWRDHRMPRSEAGGWLRMNPTDGQGVGDANVTAFRFALLECDDLPVELQLSLFARLPLPVAAIFTSGGRSLHSWVRVDAGGAQEYRNTVSTMLALLAKFDVDGKNKNPSRLSRLPGVVRRIGEQGGGRQRLLYLNPHPEQRRILP